jgi:hypothetical protein
LRVLPAEVARWVEGAEKVQTETPLWSTLVAMQRPLIRRIREIDWAHRPARKLVEDFHIAGNIYEGMAHFPSPSGPWSLAQRRDFYLTNFLIHGHAAIEDNSHEDFDGLAPRIFSPSHVRFCPLFDRLPTCSRTRPSSRRSSCDCISTGTAMPPCWPSIKKAESSRNADGSLYWGWPISIMRRVRTAAHCSDRRQSSKRSRNGLLVRIVIQS